MAKILLIETSSEVCSAAISVDGEVLALSENLETQSHAALLTLQIRECSNEAGIPLAQLDAVALSRGPGSYTALRVGASVAKGICYALEKPLIAVDTLHSLAHASNILMSQYPNNPIFVPVLDARRQELWLAAYDADLREIAPAQPLVLENNSFEEFIAVKCNHAGMSGVILAGNGMEKIRSGGFSEKITFTKLNKCCARYLAALAEQFFQSADFQDIAYFEPFYMKPPNITTPGKAAF